MHKYIASCEIKLLSVSILDRIGAARHAATQGEATGSTGRRVTLPILAFASELLVQWPQQRQTCRSETQNLTIVSDYEALRATHLVGAESTRLPRPSIMSADRGTSTAGNKKELGPASDVAWTYPADGRSGLKADK